MSPLSTDLIQMDAKIERMKQISEKDLDPANWTIETLSTDCGFPCTPNGCAGHPTKVPDELCIGSYVIRFPTDDISDDVDWANLEAIGAKLKEVIEFYVAAHKH